jgi:Uncharacterized conserved protein
VTFSLAARCSRTGQFGVVIASSSPAVGARCAWARAGVGAACSQNVTDPALGPALLDALADGCTAEQALDRVVAGADHVAYRQLTVVDADGRAAGFSGEQTLGVHATAAGPSVVAAGNLLADKVVPQAMLDAFGALASAELGDRLMAALRAASAAGGEAGPAHSAGLLIVDAVSWPVTDLRVDWSDDPVGELARLWELWQPQAGDYLARALDPTTARSYGVPGDA